MASTLDITSWPATVRNLPSWPKEGITYSYEHRGYIRPQKLEHWLMSAFGASKAKYALWNGRLYIKAPRKPTLDEREWMEDTNADSGVEVAEYGWLTLADKENTSVRSAAWKRS